MCLCKRDRYSGNILLEQNGVNASRHPDQAAGETQDHAHDAYDTLSRNLLSRHTYDAGGDTIRDVQGYERRRQTCSSTLSTSAQNTREHVYTFGRFSGLVAASLKRQAAGGGENDDSSSSQRCEFPEEDLSERELTSWVDMDDIHSLVCAFFGRFSHSGLLKLGLICQKMDKNASWKAADGAGRIPQAKTKEEEALSTNATTMVVKNPMSME